VLTSLRTQRIDLINEDHATLLASFSKDLLDTQCTEADDHTGYLTTREVEEWHICLMGDCSRHERLACSRRTNQQGTAWNLRPHAAILLRPLQEVHDLLELLCRSLRTGDILERCVN